MLSIDEINELQKENKRLIKENKKLKEEIKYLKSQQCDDFEPIGCYGFAD